MEFELISAIITTYKRPSEFVMRAVNSVLNQTYPKIELIIVDDSPGDFVGRDEVRDSILMLNDSRVKYIRHEKNLGACAARNTGIAASQGNYLAFLDDDDEWLPEKLDKQYSKMLETGAGLVYCSATRCYVKSDKSVDVFSEKCSGYIFDKLIVTNMVGSTSYPLIKKECFEKTGGFDVEMQSAQDYEMWLRISKEYTIDYVDESLVRYYIHDGERITSNPVKKINGLERINVIYMDYLKSHKKVYGNKLVALAPYYCLNNQYIKGFVYLIKGSLMSLKSVHFNYNNLKWCINIILSRCKD